MIKRVLIRFSLLFLILLVIYIFYLKIIWGIPTKISNIEIKSIAAEIPINERYNNFDITGEDFNKIIDAYNEARVISNKGQYLGYVIRIVVYLKDGSSLLLIEDSPNTVLAQYIKPNETVVRKIEVPRIAELIHELRVEHKASW